MDMRNVLPFFVFAMLLIVAQGANAAVVERIEVTNCSFSSSQTLTCGNTETVSCQVLDTFLGSPAPVIVAVRMQVGTTFAEASLTSGTTRNGTWTATVDPETYAVNDQLVLNRVSAQDSATNAGVNGCDFSPNGAAGFNFEDAECIGSTGAVATVATDCSCSYTTETSCSTRNVLTTTKYASAGCTGVASETTTTTGYCDYCDPQWVASVSACTSSKEYNVTDGLIGVAQKRYTALDQNCVDLAQSDLGDPNDADPPADDGVLLLCRLDAWAAGGGDASGSNRHPGSTSVRTGSTEREEFSIVGTIGTDVAGRVLKPLVFDVQGDGVQEFVIFDDDGGITVKTVDGTVVSSVNFPGVQWEGQPSLWNYNYAGMQLWAPGLRDGTQGVGVAGIYYNLTDNEDYFVAVRFAAGSGTPSVRTYSITDETGDDAWGSGVVCSDVMCAYVLNSMKIVIVNTNATSITYGSYILDPLSPGAVSLSNDLSVTPVLVSVGNTSYNITYDAYGPRVVAWLGISTTSKLAWFACTLNGACDVQDLSYSGELLNASNVVVGKTVVTGNNAYTDLYFTYSKNESGTTSSWVNTIRLSSFGIDNSGVPTSVAFANSLERQVSGVIGGAAECISEPAAAKCANGQQGVAVLSSWVPQQSSVVVSPWSVPERVSLETKRMSLPFSGVSETSPNAVSRVFCGASRCYVLSGATSTSQNRLGDYSLYGNVADSAYTQISLTGAIVNVSVPVGQLGPGGTCFSSLNAGSRIVAAGVYGDEPVLLVETPEYSATNNCTAALASGKLLKYNLRTSNWEVMYDFGVKQQKTIHEIHRYKLFGSQSVGKLRCGENGNNYCMWEKGGSASGVFTAYGYNVVNMGTNTLHVATLKGSYFGGALNATIPWDYIYTDAGDDVFSVGNAVVFYDVPSSPTILATSLDSATKYVGLAEDSAGRIFWTGVPITKRAGGGQIQSSSVCSYGATNDVSVDTYAFSAPGLGDFAKERSIVAGSCSWCIDNVNVSRSISYCNATIQRYIVGGAVDVMANAVWETTYVEAVSMSNPYDAFNWRSYASFDAEGDYYVVHPFTLSSWITSPPTYTNKLVMSTYAVTYRDGGVAKTYFPAGVNMNYDPSWSVNTNDQIGSESSCIVTNGGGGLFARTQTIGDTSGIACFPYAASRFGGWVETSPSPLSARFVRNINTATGQVVVDFMNVDNITSASVPYNQLDCYSSTGTNVATDTSKQLGSYYCTKQVSTAEVNADGRDELLTPQGLFSIGGSSVVRAALGGNTATASSATAIVDVNGDTFADVYQVTAAGIQGLVSTAANVGFSEKGIQWLNETYCNVVQERDYECESFGGSVADCTDTKLYYAPQMLGSIDPSNVKWTARVYKNTGGADLVLGQNVLNGEETYGALVDALVKFLKLDAAYGVYRPLVYSIAATDLLVQQKEYSYNEYGVLTITSPGTYVVNVDAVDQTTGQSVSGAQCIVANVTLPAGQSSPGVTETELSCSLGENNVDGEFNYDGASLDSYGWVVRQVGTAPYTVKDGKLQATPTRDGTLQITHGMTCDDVKGLIQVKLRMNTLSEGIAQFSVYGTMVETGVKVPVSTFQVAVNANRVLTITAYGGEDSQQVYLGNVNTSQELVINVEVDRFAKVVRTSLNGSVADAVTTSLLNEAYGQFSGVVFSASGPASVYLDYIRFGVSGIEYNPISANQSAKQEAYASLNDCNTLSERLEALGDEQGYHPDMNRNLTQAAPHISAYCGVLSGNEGGQCLKFSQLTNAVQYNTKCYDEAYQYCLAVTYPGVNTVDGITGRQTGLDGATVCAAELTVTAGVNKIAAPTLSMVWRLFISNWYYWLLLIGLIALVSVARSRVR